MTTHSRQTLGLFLSAALLPAFALVLPRLPRRESSATVTAVASAAPIAKPRITLVTNNPANFWTIARKGAEKAAREAKVDLLFKMPASGTASEQTQIVDDLLAQGVDGIAVSPIDADNQGNMLNRAARKTLLFTFDSDAPRSERDCFVGTDNVLAGRAAGQEVKRALPRGGSIMVFVGKIDAPSASERYKGLRQALRGSKVRVLGVRTDDTDRAKAKSLVTETLRKHSRIAGLVGLWSYNGPTIWSAVRDAGKVGKVKIIAFDEEDDTLDGVASGAIIASIVQQPFRFGEVTVRAMAQVLAGDPSAIPPSGRIVIPTITIRKSNVAVFRAQLKKLRAR